MPHLIIEVSDNTLFADHDALLLALHHNLLLTQAFTANDIKSRCYIADASLVGLTATHHHFVTITLKIMPGRSAETQQTFIDGLISTVKQQLIAKPDQRVEITVEVLELNAPQYRKLII